MYVLHPGQLQYLLGCVSKQIRLVKSDATLLLDTTGEDGVGVDDALGFEKRFAPDSQDMAGLESDRA